MHDFKTYIFETFAQTIRSWSVAVAEDIYALAFLILNDDDDLRCPTVRLLYNTETEWRRQCDCANPAEAHWNHPFWLELSRQEDYQVALNHDKTLVCVYDSARSFGLFVLYNTQNGDLWTRRPAYDHKGWQVYYEQLKAENPDLPNKSFFEN